MNFTQHRWYADPTPLADPEDILAILRPSVPLPTIPFRDTVRGEVATEARRYFHNQVGVLKSLPHWSDRYGVLLRIAEDQLASEMHPDLVRLAYRNARTMVTAALEKLHETEIADLTQAAFYAISRHGVWRMAAENYLKGLTKLEIGEWQKRHGDYVQLVASIKASSAKAKAA